MTDTYPIEEGFIDDGMVVGFARCIGTVNLHYTVFTTAPASSTDLWVQQGADDADSIGVALKAGATNDRIPVCFYGVVKMKAAETAINEGDILENDATSNLLLPITTIGASDMTCFRGLNYTGTRVRFGKALQAGAASVDELLVLVGRVV